jgi:transposase-like protein
MPNPIWTSVIASTIQKLSKKCTHCGKSATYPKKQAGQYYTCKHCGHRFREKDLGAKK